MNNLFLTLLLTDSWEDTMGGIVSMLVAISLFYFAYKLYKKNAKMAETQWRLLAETLRMPLDLHKKGIGWTSGRLPMIKGNIEGFQLECSQLVKSGGRGQSVLSWYTLSFDKHIDQEFFMYKKVFLGKLNYSEKAQKFLMEDEQLDKNWIFEANDANFARGLWTKKAKSLLQKTDTYFQKFELKDNTLRYEVTSLIDFEEDRLKFEKAILLGVLLLKKMQELHDNN
ncbi:MAG: hypothetical protein GY810_30500 [Aureispira sp.]|nr:hypothetical protein [Aureispira sp.]